MKLRSILCVVLILSMILSGCVTQGGADQSQGTAGDNPLPGSQAVGADGQSQVRDSLNYGITSEPPTLDPVKIYDFKGFAIFNQIYDTLILSKSDGTLAPGLAESWDISDDGTEVTFHLREGVKFHNGETMTAEDVAFSLNRAIESPIISVITSSMESAEIIDENTVKLNLQYPFGAVEYCVGHANMSIVSKKAVEADPDGFERSPVGTGPYKFVEWKNGDKYVFERFDDYWRGPAAIKNLTFKIIIDNSTAVIALENGEIDVLDSPPSSDRDNLINNPNLQYHETENAATYFVVMNNEKGPFANKKVREAVSYAVDKEAMLIAGADGIGSILDCFPAKSSFGYPDDVKGNPYDPKKAKELLAEAGFSDGFDCTLITTEEAKYYKPAEVLQDQLGKIGINASIVKLERSVWIASIRQQNDYEISILGTSAPYPDSNYIYPIFHSKNIENGENYFRNRVPELDQLLDDARVSQDQEERKSMYKRICEIINEDAIALPLYSPMVAVAGNKDITGMQANALTRYYVYDYSWEQ